MLLLKLNMHKNKNYNFTPTNSIYRENIIHKQWNHRDKFNCNKTPPSKKTTVVIVSPNSHLIDIQARKLNESFLCHYLGGGKKKLAHTFAIATRPKLKCVQPNPN